VGWLALTSEFEFGLTEYLYSDSNARYYWGMLALVLLQAPLGTYLGWNITASGFHKGQVCNYQGGWIPFAKTKAERMALALLLGAPELDQLAVDGSRPLARGDGDVPAIGAGDDVDGGKGGCDRLDAGEKPLVVLGLLFFQGRDLPVDLGAVRLDRIDVAHGHGGGAARKDEAHAYQQPPAPAHDPPTPGPHPSRRSPTLYPAGKLALDQMDEHAYAALAVVEAGDVAEPLAAMLEEDLLVLLGDLLERLDAIGGKAR